jgi:transposase-like protein
MKTKKNGKKQSVLEHIKSVKARKRKWTDENYVKCYLLAAEGKSYKSIARSLGVEEYVMKQWMEDMPALRKAYNDGKERHGTRGEESEFFQYVHKHLPERVRKVWDQIMAVQDAEDCFDRMEAILSSKGKRMRQHLFIHALISRNFDPSKACTAVGISMDTVNLWKNADEGFAKLLDEVQQHKKNFFEGALVRLVKKGDVSATLFANRTLNRDRGYGDKTQIEVSGSLNHNHKNLINFEDLGLPPEVLRVIYEAVKEKKERELNQRGEVPLLTLEGKAVPVGIEGGANVHANSESEEA